VVEFGAGVDVPLWVTHIGTLDSTAEYRGNTGTIQQVSEYQAVLAGLRYTVANGVAAHAGVDFGLTNSVPGYSVLAGISYSGLQPPPTYAEPGKEKVVYRDRVVLVERIAFPDINFEFDKATLTDVGRGRCYLVAQKLKGGKNVKIEIQGHSDYIGTEDYNKKLGMQRAEAVKAELVRLGIDPARISTVSFGEDRPLVDMQTPWARAMNRRAEFVVIGEPTAPTAGGEAAPARAP
jgi:outer membrane protein OmpA-like peptidoglycan-associated protein